MKEFKKDEQGLYICEECQKAFKQICHLSVHISKKHCDKKDYYDKWIKNEDDGICKTCGKETEFTNSLRKGYKNCCCEQCSFKYTYKQIEIGRFIKHGDKNYNNREKCVKTNLERYGVYYTATQEYKNKLLEHFGVINVFQLEEVKQKSKQTCLEHFGVEFSLQNPEVREKGKETSIKKYGVDHPSKSPIIQKKKEDTCFKNHGVKNPFQSLEIREKGDKTKEERYGDKNFINLERCKQTKKERYGDENYNNREKFKETCNEKFGVDHPFQTKEVKQKSKETWLKHFGVDHPSKSSIVQNKKDETCFKNHGVKNPFQSLEIRQKGKNTKKERYGNENYRNDAKIKETCLKLFGVENPQQNIEIHKKTLKSALLLKYFRDTNIYYRGSYEEDFLDKHYDLFPDIINGPTIKYEFNGKIKVYYPDFYIPSLNLIVEIKNPYLAKQDKEKIEAKKSATLLQGYNYIMIVEKDYTEFKKLVSF